MAEPDREVVIRLGAEVEPSVKAAAKQAGDQIASGVAESVKSAGASVRSEVADALKPSDEEIRALVESYNKAMVAAAKATGHEELIGTAMATPDLAATRAQFDVMAKMRDALVEKAKSGERVDAADIKEMAGQATHVAAAFNGARHAASALARGDLPAAAASVAQIARHASLAGSALAVVGAGAGAFVATGVAVAKVTDALREQHIEWNRNRIAAEQMRDAATSGSLEQVRGVIQATGANISQIEEQWAGRSTMTRLFGSPIANLMEAVGQRIFGKGNVFRNPVAGSDADREKQLEQNIKIRSGALERETLLMRERVYAEEDFRSGRNRTALVEHDIRRQYDDQAFAIDQQLKYSKDLTPADRASLGLQKGTLAGHRDEAIVRARTAEKQRQLDLDNAAQEAEEARVRQGEKISREIRERMEVERAELSGAKEFAEILKIRLHYENLISHAQENNATSQQIQDMEAMRDFDIRATIARHAAASEAETAETHRNIVRRARGEAGFGIDRQGARAYTDIRGNRVSKTGTLMDPFKGSPVASVDEFGNEDTRDATLKPVGQGSPFDEWHSQQERDDYRHRVQRENREAVGKLAKEEGISRAEARRRLREQGEIKSSDMPSKSEQAQQDARQAAEAWTPSTVAQLMTKLDSIDRKLPGGFAP